MSKTPTDPRDWSTASEALFRSARSDHASSAADRERVRSALARKFADVPQVPAARSDAPLGAARKGGATLSNLAKIGIGVVIIAVGAFTLRRSTESEHPAESKPAPSQSSTAVSPASAPIAPALPDTSEGVAAPSSQASTPANYARRTRERTTAIRVPATTRPAPEPAVAAPAIRETETVANPPATSSPSTAAPAFTSEIVAPQRAPEKPVADAPPEPAAHRETRDANEPDPSLLEARAELALVQRIHEALRTSDSAVVLALSAEHARRWPKGMFVQEREGLRAIASCRSATRNAVTRARAFLAKYPHGPLAPRVREACASELAALAYEKSTPQ